MERGEVGKARGKKGGREKRKLWIQGQGDGERERVKETGKQGRKREQGMRKKLEGRKERVSKNKKRLKERVGEKNKIESRKR